MAILNATAYLVIAKYSCRMLTNIWKSVIVLATVLIVSFRIKARMRINFCKLVSLHFCLQYNHSEVMTLAQELLLVGSGLSFG